VAVAAKNTSDTYKTVPFPPNPNSPESTIRTVEREIREAGGDATAIAVDTRDFASLERLVGRTMETYGRLDFLIYNSGAIWWASVEKTPMKRFQLMQRVNIEGVYGAIQATLPQFERNGWKGRIIVVSPPIYSRFFRGKTAYAMEKIGMSVLTKGSAVDWEREAKTGMAITSIWPAAAIQSAATENVGHENIKDLRKPTIYSDAILAILRAPLSTVNGCLELDEGFFRKIGMTDFSKYNVVPGSTPRRIMPAEFPDLTVSEQHMRANELTARN
jgi:NAD(P)-dependent dehydrogenase (short-subunit alcohol dehydrogenase family)